MAKRVRKKCRTDLDEGNLREMSWQPSQRSFHLIMKMNVKLHIIAIGMQLFSAIFSYFQLFSVIFSYFQLFSVIFSYFQLFSVIFSYFQLFSAIFSYFQLYSVIFSYIQLFSGMQLPSPNNN